MFCDYRQKTALPKIEYNELHQYDDKGGAV